MIENQLAPVVSLNGEWHITIGDQTGPIQVPGVWETQGYPIDVDEARYSRSFEVPADWTNARIFLHFGAISYLAEVSVNGQVVGTHEGLWTPFECDVTAAIKPGECNQIEVRVVKPSNNAGGEFPYRKVLVGFIPYVSTTFGGIWQDAELVAHRAAAWRDIHITADWRTGRVTIKAGIHAVHIPELTTYIEIRAANGAVVSAVRQAVSEASKHKFEVFVDDPQRWSPESPTLYEARLLLIQGNTTIASTARRFGFRQLHTDGDHLLLNGEPANLRGILAWGWNPDTLAPTPTDADIRDEFRRVRDMGFNLYKLCLYLPTPNVFDIADEEGMLLWLELPLWWQILDDHLRQQALVEYTDILAQVHHHPSIVIYSLGCELGADMADAALLDTLNAVVRGSADNVLVCDNSGSGEAYDGLTDDLADFNDYHFYAELQDFTPLLNHFRRDWRAPRPWIFGEFCFSDDYRDPAQLIDSHGQRAWWRDLLGVGSGIERWAYRDQEARMQALGLPQTDEELVGLSRRKSLLIRKHTLETVRSRRGMGGYVVTGLRDTPISTSGLFDDHNQPKFDTSAFTQFNADCVLLMEQGRVRKWINADQPYPRDQFNHWSGSTASFRIILNYVGTPPADHVLRWWLTSPDNLRHMKGEIPVTARPAAGVPGEIAHIDLVLPDVPRPEQWTLVVKLGDHITNHWPLWLYPQPPDFAAHTTFYDPSGALPDFQHLPRHDFATADTRILITCAYTPDVKSFIESGGQAILLQIGPGTVPTIAKSFWSMSLVLLENHPVLAQIPHDGVAGLQFYHLAADYAFDTSQIQAAIPEARHLKTVVRGLDMRLFTVFDYLLALEIGKGRLLASTLRFSGGRGDQVRSLEANILGRFLLSEMINYLRQ